MSTALPRKTFVLAILAVFAGGTNAWASGATFAITGQGITLGAAEEVQEDGKPQPPRFQARAEVGKPFTLTAQGMVLPRGAKAQPGEPDAGAWTFDEKRFKRLSPDGPPADKTKVLLRLEPTAVGTSRIRFAGKILGYERTFDVLVEAVDRKKD